MTERLAETAAKARVALGGDATVEDVLHLFRDADHSVRDTYRVLTAMGLPLLLVMNDQTERILFSNDRALFDRKPLPAEKIMQSVVWDKSEKPLPTARPWETVLTLWKKYSQQLKKRSV